MEHLDLLHHHPFRGVGWSGAEQEQASAGGALERFRSPRALAADDLSPAGEQISLGGK